MSNFSVEAAVRPNENMSSYVYNRHCSITIIKFKKKSTSSVVGVQTSSQFLGFSTLGDEYSCKTLIAESDFDMPDFNGSSPLCLLVCIVPFSTPASTRYYRFNFNLFECFVIPRSLRQLESDCPATPPVPSE